VGVDPSGAQSEGDHEGETVEEEGGGEENADGDEGARRRVDGVGVESVQKEERLGVGEDAVPPQRVAGQDDDAARGMVGAFVRAGVPGALHLLTATRHVPQHHALGNVVG
jgi:hypothetical protein